MFLPFSLLLLIVDSAVAGHSNPNLFTRAHQLAAKHTKSFARDLRITFRAVLPRDEPPSGGKTRVVYCVSNPSNSTNNGNTGNKGSGSSSTKGGATSTKTSSKPQATGGAVSTPWSLNETHAGQSFFNGWTFWTDSDPTHGIVDYLDQSDASNAGLLNINDAGNAIMAVETTATVASNRKSIRIYSQSSWNGALVILDAVHMPTGCGTWPAFWMNGPNWPQGGEIDIVEGVGDYTHNQATIHTNPGCNLPTSNPSTLGMTGTVVGGTDCSVAASSNQGCGVRSASAVSYGAAFNNNGGGVYALQWDETGISVFFFERSSIPADIEASTPQPDNWGQPMAHWPASGCDPFKFFYDNVIIFDTTLCGDWAGAVWGSSGIPGQEQSCATRTGYANCVDFVRANGASFQEAYWEVKSVKIYTKNN